MRTLKQLITELRRLAEISLILAATYAAYCATVKYLIP